MRTAVLIAVCITALSACFAPMKPQPVLIPPAPIETPQAPFSDDPVSFLVSHHFVPGEFAIVKVCLGPDRSVISTSLVESSGDLRFDHMALGWAQSVRLRSIPDNKSPIAPCGDVRVEIRAPSEPKVLSGPATSLG